PHLKAVFTLSYAQSMLVQFAFFGAYFVGSVAYFALSLRGSDPIRRLGYKRASIAGLLLSALGAVLFVPATYVHVYGAYLAALFVLGLGFTLLQIAANPFVAIIGEPEGASGRLNLAQAFNSLGTTLAPIVGGALIFRLFAGDAAVRWPYLAFAGLLVLQAAWLWLTRLPEPPPSKAATGRAWEHPQLVRGMVAIFCYVGAEVAIGSLLISFAGLPRVMGLTADDAKVYLSLYWGGAMIGRFLGAISLGRQMPARWRTVVMVGLGLVLFWLLFVLNRLESGVALDQVNTLLLFIGLNIFVFHLAGPNAGRALGLFALVTMGLLVAAVSGGGPWALWALTA
ncbi:MAG: MFS transporter, partial [Flavobacteriales bacterium]|nr:MFS transporter [Flavobacteriales bacterium]